MLPGIVKEIVAAMRLSEKTFWAGWTIPRFDMTASARIYDPSSGFRVENGLHQQFSLAFLVEKDLGGYKQWPLILDEALRLLAPGGMLVLRYRQSRLLSTLELVRFMTTWSDGVVEPVAQQTAGPEITSVFRLATNVRRASSALSWSFGLVTDRNDLAMIGAFIDSAERLRRRSVLDCEIFVSGPSQVGGLSVRNAHHVTFIPLPDGAVCRGGRGSAKNLIAAASRRENLLIVSDGYALPVDFAESLNDFGGDFTAICPREVTIGGAQVPDWLVTRRWPNSGPTGWMDHGDYHPDAHFSRGVVMGKTATLRKIGWSGSTADQGTDNLDLSRRMQESGVTLRPSTVSVIAPADRERSASEYQRVPWLGDRYVHPANPADDGSNTSVFARNELIELTDVLLHPHEHGLVLPDGWIRDSHGWHWTDEKPPLFSLLLDDWVESASLALDITGVGSRVWVNGALVKAAPTRAGKAALEFGLTADNLAHGGNAHIRFERSDGDMPITLSRAAVGHIVRQANCEVGVPVPLREATQRILEHGWNDPEDWGAWSSESRSTLVLIVNASSEVSLTLRLGMQIAFLGANDKVSVAVHLNGEACGSTIFSAGADSQSVAVPVPASCAAAGILRVTLETSRLAPASLSGNAADRRLLGIGLYELRLDESPSSASLMRSGIGIGQLVQISAKSNHLFLVSGWHPPEEWGVWSSACEAVLQVPLTGMSTEQTMMVLNVRGLAAPALPPPALAIIANGSLAAHLVVEGDDTHQIRFPIVPTLAAGEELIIRFIVSRTSAPGIIGATDERRKLGIGLISFRLEMATS